MRVGEIEREIEPRVSFIRASANTSLYEIESFFLADFLRVHGAFPICNNQSGWTIIEPKIAGHIKVAWNHFA